MHLIIFFRPVVFTCRFVLFLFFMGLTLSNGYADTVSENHVSRGATNAFTVVMHINPCDGKSIYNATAEYENELRVYVKPLKKGSFTINMPFKGNTYPIDLKSEVKKSFDAWQEEAGLKYRFVASPGNANVIVILDAPWDYQSMSNATFVMALGKGLLTFSRVEVQDFLRSVGIDEGVGAILMPTDPVILMRFSDSLARMYDSGREEGHIGAKVSPKQFLSMTFRQGLVRAIGHIIGFSNALPTVQSNKIPNGIIIMPDTKQYDKQPPITLATFSAFVLFYEQWKSSGLASADAIIPSPQEVDAYRAAQKTVDKGVGG